jgi:periplasmic protein CpxP/Spy
MSERDPTVRNPTSSSPGRRPRRTGAYIAVAIVGVTAVAAFAGSSFSQGLRHGLLSIPDTMVEASFDSRFGPGFGSDWVGALPNSVIEAVIDVHVDRMIRHLAVEIDATSEQQDKLRAIVRAAAKDLLPVRDKVLAGRAAGRDLLTQQTIDRPALERLRADQIATHDAVSKRLVQAVADAAETLTPEQRRKLSDMVSSGGWGADHGPGRHWGWGGFGRN